MNSFGQALALLLGVIALPSSLTSEPTTPDEPSGIPADAYITPDGLDYYKTPDDLDYYKTP